MLEDLKKLGRHSVIYGIGIFFNYALGFILIPLYTRKLATAEYGVYEIIGRTFEVFVIFLAVGLRVTAVRFYQDGDDVDRKKRVISTAVLFLVPFAAAVLAIGQMLAAPLTTLMYGGVEHQYLVRLMLTWIFCEMCVLIPSAYLVARVKSVLYITAAGVQFALGLGLNLYLVLVRDMGVEGILLANTIAAGCFALVIGGYTLHAVGLGFDRGLLKQMMKFGLPFVPGGILLFILNSGDRFFLLHYGGEDAVGLYGLGYKIASLISLAIMTPFLRVWFVMMMRIVKRPDHGVFFAKVFTYVLLLYAWVGLGLSILSQEVVGLVADPRYLGGHAIIPLVVLGYFFYSTINLTDSGFYITKRTAIKPFLLAAGAAVNLALYWLLIPRYGAMGAAWATVFSFGFFAVLTFVVSNRVFPLPYELGRFVKLLAAAIVWYLAARWIAWPAPAMLWKFLWGLVFPLALFPLRFYEKRELVKARELLRELRGIKDAEADVLAPPL